ncbi:dihydrolipoamide acetyltransferase family protein [Jiangella alkaliphila]|uniref:Dihydrolipoamide acetyltransferase component of pyruvate dehydrogenase complex n=1 Tax=Jiangella alkaliphila TaxID=419479 RepID=A0A1H2HWJ5_9ACTN|nr:dihydrolipoamide acetyltransferase family protein [Jiangella alkaliphila]SDU36261.1 pyruvate dehydrogenase E2 component (dihydrolipoamide acetyltransferase) [Jiangella alkaliphila]
MSVSQFNLPDVGEGLTEAEIVSWKVKPGDAVKVNDVIVEIETAKSLVELPCPFDGVVETLLVDEGQTVDVGTPIIAVRTGAGDAATAVGGPAEDLVPVPPAPAEPEGERQAVLVGYGPRTTAAKRRPRKGAVAAVPEPVAPPPVPVAPAPEPAVARVSVLAKPPVRKLAKDLGVDLTIVVPTGPNGTISRDDVQAAVAAPAVAPVAVPAGTGTGWDGLPRQDRVAIRSVRKATAKAVTTSAFTAPHVTEFVTFDITRTMKLVERLRESRDFRDVKLSPLAVVAKAVCIAARRTPDVNARWDDAAGEIVLQRYVNLGIAAATPRGLVVPNVKDADRLPLRGLAVAINQLAATAREGRTPPEDMLGGTISITNVGVFGVDTGTPILPPGEAAILAFGAVRKQPWVHNDEVKPRWVTTLALSFDHRLVDGEQGSRFLADVAALLEDPGNALVWA